MKLLSLAWLSAGDQGGGWGAGMEGMEISDRGISFLGKVTAQHARNLWKQYGITKEFLVIPREG